MHQLSWYFTPRLPRTFLFGFLGELVLPQPGLVILDYFILSSTFLLFGMLVNPMVKLAITPKVMCGGRDEFCNILLVLRPEKPQYWV